MIKVRVPATSANMGSGFDSLGLALTLYNFVSIEKISTPTEIKIIGEGESFLPADENNLIYKCVEKVFDAAGEKMVNIRLVMENNIPVTRGLGSSSASIVGGLIAANALLQEPFSKEEILSMAAEIEGHGDNVTPAVFGGFCVNVPSKNKINYISTPVKDDLEFATFIPDFFLQTKKSRAALPEKVLHRDAVFNLGRSALLTASIISGKYENIRTSMGDRLHQDYRKKFIPGMNEIFDLCYNNKALGVYLSGAGPTIIGILNGKSAAFSEKVTPALNKKMKNWHLSILKADNEGAVILGGF